MNLVRDVLVSWGRILSGRAPILSIEITRECPLSCPGCYAYGDTHLGGDVTLRQLNDFRGDALVDGVLELVRRHRPIHVSLVGGEPMMRHRELDRILPALSEMGVFTFVVTSGVIPIPKDWMRLPRLRVTVSIDGLPEHHDVRRKPATYDRILRNIAGCLVNLHLTVTRPMMQRDDYLEQYFAFWTARPEVHHIELSTYTPQQGEQTPEMLTPEDRRKLIQQLPDLRRRYPQLLVTEGMTELYGAPPANPRACTFAQMSVNYSADLKTRVEPCIFGGTPDCTQCGCAASIFGHWLSRKPVLGPLTAGHIARSSMKIGSLIGRLHPESFAEMRWKPKGAVPKPAEALVQIQS